jgi:hypothetical protein
VNEGIYTRLAGALPAERRELPEQEILDRTLLAMVNEAARVLEDGIVASAGDALLASLKSCVRSLNAGFP